MNDQVETGTKVLWWADLIMDGTFFVLQTYLTQVWKMSFTKAAAFLNIWGGIYRILPVFFLFLADTLLGNFVTLALSGIFSTTGIVLVTVAASVGYRCHKEGEEECVGHAEKALFIMGMAFVALGRAARFASTKPFIDEQTTTTSTVNADESQTSNRTACNCITSSVLGICYIMFFLMPAVAFFAFPYVEKWYLLFGVSAICTAFATVTYVTGFRAYDKPGPKAEGSPLTDIFRVFVAASFNISRPYPDDKTPLHQVEGQEFQELSSSRMLGFLHKAAIKLDDDNIDHTSTAAEAVIRETRSWRVCSVSEVESAKIMIRMVSLYIPYLMSGVVVSIGNTYFVEQINNMNYNIGSWKPPLQLVQLMIMADKFFVARNFDRALKLAAEDKNNVNLAHESSAMGAIFSTVCCTVAAAVERRRLHAVRRHGLLDQPDTSKIPMSAYWLGFQIIFLGIVEVVMNFSLSEMLNKEAPKSMMRYHECLGEGVVGLGFMCGALSVYVVGIISEIGSSNNNWFQHTLNRSRLDRYYWVLSVLTSLNLLIVVNLVDTKYRRKKTLTQKSDDVEVDGQARRNAFFVTI